MTAILLTIYVLMWPVIVLGVLILISRAYFKEVRQAKREGRMII